MEPGALYDPTLYRSVCVICLVKTALSQLKGNICIHTGAESTNITKSQFSHLFHIPGREKKSLHMDFPLFACGFLSFKSFPSERM